MPFLMKNWRTLMVALTACYSAVAYIQWIRSLSNCDCLSFQLWTITVEVASINGQIDIVGYDSPSATAAIAYTHYDMHDFEYIEYINRMGKIAAGRYLYLSFRHWQMIAAACVLCGVVLWVAGTGFGRWLAGIRAS